MKTGTQFDEVRSRLEPAQLRLLQDRFAQPIALLPTLASGLLLAITSTATSQNPTDLYPADLVDLPHLRQIVAQSQGPSQPLSPGRSGSISLTTSSGLQLNPSSAGFVGSAVRTPFTPTAGAMFFSPSLGRSPSAVGLISQSANFDERPSSGVRYCLMKFGVLL